MEGDGLNSFLRETSVDDPVLCIKCHTRQGKVTGTDHDMRVVAPDIMMPKDTGSSPNSVCSPCHAVHNASNQAALWNAPLSAHKEDFMEQACYGCHNPAGIGRNKLVEIGSHPRRIHFGYNKPYPDPLHKEMNPVIELPLYDAKGNKSPSGEITCSTCHDPHIWQAGKSASGHGKNIEGSTVDSFLRKDIRKGLCYECHGIQTLFLYRYYHVVEERRKITGPYTPHFKQSTPRNSDSHVPIGGSNAAGK